MWEAFQHRFFGFLPERGTLVIALIYFAVCFISLKVSEKMTHAYAMPWQKEENKQARERIRKEESE
ncbi:hypothetical protein [Alteribacter natronophilus]|uniref:hypothetical protein n=1 Tax=Alteribacter natronophilus TaxID=2583810 RepID=UPI00110DEE53|nr:hypothetical protein [Alteribacter natronophilus]TMW73996.1 hypothetical protein FGB90_06935 [Alteribacter natronophilus]